MVIMELLQKTIGTLLLALLMLSILWRMLLPAVLRGLGVVVEGYVFDRGTRSVRYGTVYYLSYRYDYQWKTYTHNQRVDEDTFHIWSEGGNAEVRCLPMLASIARLEV
jgi:hypothetical protein